MNPATMFDSAMAGLQSAQAGMLATSQNVAGSTVAGYVRRSPNLKIAGLAPSGLEKTGTSFAVEGFTRNYSALLQKQLLAQQSQTSYTSTLTTSVAALDAMMVDASASVSGALGTFFNAAGSLANEPDNTAFQHALVGAANQVADRIRGLANEVDRIRGNALQGLADVLNQANSLAPQLATVNGQIKGAYVPGVSTASADLLDERDRITSQLQALIGGTTLINDDGTASYLVQGQHLVDRQIANQFTNSTGTTPVSSAQGPNDIRLKVASSPGLLPHLIQLGFAERVSDAGTPNQKTIPAQSAFKDGQAGAYNHLIQTFVPTLQMSLNLLSLQLVQKSNGMKTIFGFASLSASNQQLTSLPLPGDLGFDYSSLLGNNRVSIKTSGGGYEDGKYLVVPLTGGHGQNAKANITIVGNQVTAIELIDAGEGYEVGDELSVDLPNGVNGIDCAFKVDELAHDFTSIIDKTNPNSTHFDEDAKRALLYSPINAKLFQSVLQASDLDTADASVGVQLESLRQTFTKPLTFISSSVATTIATWKNDQKANDAMSQILSDQKNAVSGVNLDEEAANLVKYQQLYNASSKLIQTGRQMFDTLLAMMSGN